MPVKQYLSCCIIIVQYYYLYSLYCALVRTYFEMRWGSTLFMMNCSQISVKERTTDLINLESDRSLTARLVWVLTSWALLWCGDWLEEMRSCACQTGRARCAAASTSHFWLPTELLITSDHFKEHCLPSSPWKEFCEQKLPSQLWTVRTLSLTLFLQHLWASEACLYWLRSQKSYWLEKN